MSISSLAEQASHVFELSGVGVMLAGLGLGAIIALVRGIRRGARDALKEFRNDLGRTILLGLEFLIAADILRTILQQPTLRAVVVLGGVVLVRTFLSFTLQLELDGHWPWQRMTHELASATELTATD